MNHRSNLTIMKTIAKTLLIAGLTLLAAPAIAADPVHGRELQEANCMSCHDNGMYTRKDRKITSPDGLEKQVRRCELSLGLQWFDEDVTDVAAYLNQNFYQFKQ
jgi:cytochrome c